MKLTRPIVNSLCYCILSFLFIFPFSNIAAQVSGTVFRDFNANGTKDNSTTFNEPFVAGVTVKAYDASGAAVGTTTTDANGAYSFSGLTLPLRIEFASASTGDYASATGSGSATSVQFYTAATTTANLSLQYPQDYCNSSNPQMIIPCFVNGDPTQGGSAGTDPVLVKFPYDASGIAYNGGTPDVAIATASNVGAVWALAYQKTTQQLFSAAFLKRHVGFGSLGIGGIYKTDIATSTTTPFVSVNSIGIDVGTDPHTGLPADATQPSYDENTFAQVGKKGIGGMDISDDGKNLWLVNLNLQTLNRVFINNPATTPTSANVTTYNIPNPNCRNGDFRPFAVKYYRGKIYVGVVCANETAQDTAGMTATVYEFDEATSAFTVVLQFPTTFRKGKTDDMPNILNYWYPWTDNTTPIIPYPSEPTYVFYPQLILSDIAFDVDGTMVISGMDRFGHQWGWFNYYPDGSHSNTALYTTTANAQLYRAGKCANTFGWTLENNASVCGTTPTAGANNNKGPGGGVFYYSNVFQTAHEELSYGGINILAGSGEVIESALDPLNFFTGGIIHLNNETGGRAAGYQIYESSYGGGNAAFGKANGLGDLVTLCNPAPLEVGNRVWTDTNQNGKQDANESGIDGVIVKLYEGSNEVGSATTANGGQYYFTNTNVTGGVKYNTAYEIRIATAQTSLNTFSLTTTDAGTNDLIDNDGTTSGANVIKAFTTGGAGENNHSYDFGFKSQPPCALTIAKVTTSGCYQNSGSKATVSVEVAWTGAPTGETITITLGGQTRTITPGAYTSTGGSGIIVSPQVVAFELAADGSTGNVVANFNTTTTCTDTKPYTLPAACPPLVCNGTDLAGTVFDDYNADGIKQAGETNGLPNVTVIATACDGTTYTATTNSEGKYNLDIPANKYPVRLEFSGLPSIYGQGTPNGADGKTTTQFFAAADCHADLGILDPNDYCQTNPKVYMPCYLNGDPNDAASAGDAAIVAVNYDITGMKSVVAPIESIASVWGIAYNKFNQNLYSAAFLRRHVGLTAAGLGGIFKTDVTNNTTTLLVDVENIGVNLGSIGDNVSRGVNVPKTQVSQDQEAYSKVGKVGMGDLDISEDGQTLYFVNLFEKKLHRLNIANPTAAPAVSIPDPQCAGGTFRPWGLKIHKGFAYVGGICDASTSTKSDLRAYVYKYDLVSNTFNSTPVFDFPLTYPKGFSWDAAPNLTGWYPWTDDQATTFVTPNSVQTSCCQFFYGDILVYPQPILSDIEIDVDGSIILGFADRFSFQTGSKNLAPDGNSGSQGQGFSSLVGGDILRAFASGNTYILENNAKAGPATGSSVGNNQGPGFGEFYNDNFINNGSVAHAENANGGLALKSGSGEVVYSAMDPEDAVSTSGGFRKVSNITGLATGAFSVYTGNLANGLFSKAGGIGDLELGCGTPPYLQIGNYVWNDSNLNGVQDACESPIANIVVELYKAGTKIAEVTTDAKGEYYFSDKNAVGVTWLGTGADTTLRPNMAYEVRIATAQTTLNNRVLTTANSTTNGGNDQIDSDASLSNGSAVITFTTGAAGSVNHTLDFGFQPASCTAPTAVTFTQTAPTCTGATANNDGKITFTSASNVDKYFINSGATSTGTYATATALPATGTDIKTNIPNAGGSYTIRFYNGAEACFRDTTVTVAAVSCVAPSPICPNPRMVTPCYVFGSYEGSTVDAFVSVPTRSSALPYENGLPRDSIQHLATFGQIGATYGTAYNQYNNTIYTAAYIKRHSALGPGGTGAIYKIDPTGVTPPAIFVDLNAIFGANTAGVNPHPYSPTDVCPDGNGGSSNLACWFNDVDAFVAVGRQGLGDLDISEDGQFLYVMNMTNKTVYKIPTVNPTIANIETFAFPTSLPNAVVACGNPTQVRPMGLGVRNGLLYVGAICTEEVDNPSGGLWGGDKVYVYSLNPSTGVWSTAPKMEGNIRRANTGLRALQWTASYQGNYADGSHMILSDIEFASNEEMLIGIRDISGDRFGNQAGKPIVGNSDIVTYAVAGDLLKACLDGSTNQFVLENNGSCGGVTTNGPASAQGIPASNATAKEYFFGEGLLNSPVHTEISLGGVAYLPATNEVFITAYDLTNVYQQGFLALSNQTGDRTASFVLIENTLSSGQFGKTNGLGDLELVCSTLSVCTTPTAITFTKTAPTCTGATANNDGKITFTSATNADKYFINSGTTSTGTYTTATALPATGTDIQTNIPNTGGSYTIRFYNGAETCFKDTTVTVAAVTCVAPCSITATFTQGTCNNNGTLPAATDDYFTITVSNVTATNGGASNKYEVIYNGTVLNTGGTAYGTSVTVGNDAIFHADGTTTYALKIRDLDTPTCETTIFTTTAVNRCSTVNCPTVICLPVTVTRSN